MAKNKLDKLKLMVVDDELDNLDLLYRTFWRDYQVYQASNANEALSILDQQGEMAVIISDQRMPDINGSELLRLTVNRFPDTIRILLTGFTDVEDLVDAINSGQVFKYITKPWNPHQLKSLVSQATDTYRLIKKRTQELSRALKRESLFNLVNTAIRDSLDYDNMLQKIVHTIGENFTANYYLLQSVENNFILKKQFFYQKNNPELLNNDFDANLLIESVLQNRHYQISQTISDRTTCSYLVVPLIYQQDLLAILAIGKYSDNTNNWSPEDIDLIISISEQAALALSQAKLYQSLQEKQEQIRSELEVARQIQYNLLRQSLPEISGVKIQARCYPAREVGGDFFEVLVDPQGYLWLAVGDVSGKGVPAALFMASTISLLRRELSQETPSEPHIIMQNLNHALLDDLMINNSFITLILSRYHPKTKELIYANAGHIYPLVWLKKSIMNDDPKYLKLRSVPLGILPKWPGKSGSLIMSSGKTLLLASDGITEATISSNLKMSISNHNKDKHSGTNDFILKQEGLWYLVKSQPSPLILDNILNCIQANNHIQEDDQTILSLEVL
ncbi:SpoIIE family protein phosphatase [Anabaena sp. FACHB-1237]|uniref:SpoIIE family protein phosphatase n=1 Tax=Anabaena sp. FACHB-1237 TaxID=2692769 RepID=UPI0016815D40|nr:SpoIIE family protein phosphatase [Anabaena sp. FACHB-1237]MBD2138134.1 SpoIIE family protein phosphatase [Anabaena sp. FACHB-1237]